MKAKNNYRETETGKIPQRWDVVRVADLFKVETGTTPSTKKDEYWKEGFINWITPTDLSGLKGKIYIQKSERKITEKALKQVGLTLLPKHSLILSTRAPVGYIAILLDNATFNQGCKGLIPKNFTTIYPEFYCYYLDNKKHNLKMLSAGSTFKELSKERIENFKILFPPLPEQQKIAEVLSTVDEAIEKIEQAIEKSERVKKGLMQELLTKGIGHKEFKDTEIGRIPKEWGVVKLGEIGALQYGFTASSEKTDTGIKFLRITDIKEDGSIGWDEVPYCTINDSGFKKYKLNESNILFARIGSTTGKTCYVGRDIKGVFASYLIRLLPTKNINTKFLYFFTQSSIYWAQVNRRKEGQLKKGLNAAVLSQLEIPLPQLLEQQKIAEILDTVDKRLGLLKDKKQKFERIKKGLMNDLLTGKRRVKV
ncbi:hypothetical protein CH333_04465 [candidate division WOR-3 bacterium JGI_Cruoil_03_44_89]|uniref:Type I restriction modification DNA specificity domain-containing protein n=1 Tax=candidate division WOR-3 bacterium JGI_Cruoil_03_44_89 TaxID=1973748 RepID=A0A235BV19_UNCW3|nr:MAG: hypothetical protein CH333_04465 [candidate division WOR-3 bacterium JGI_Cruoil_03_44_89]